jgi:tetratricopeptide (TPR) repeat protein
MDTANTIAKLKQMKAASLRLRREGKMADAIETLRSATEEGHAFIASVSDKASIPDLTEVYWELADCLGMLGGNLLRQEKLDYAIDAFGQGRDIEMSQEAQIDLTYNTVNLVVARALAHGAEALEDAGDDLTEVLLRLRSKTSESGADDKWALADLGMCEFLKGNLDAAKAAYTLAAALATNEERLSLLDRLKMLRDKGAIDKERSAPFLDAIEDILK